MSCRKAVDLTLGLVPPRAVLLQLYFSILVEGSRIGAIELNLEPSHGSCLYCGLHRCISFVLGFNPRLIREGFLSNIGPFSRELLRGLYTGAATLGDLS